MRSTGTVGVVGSGHDRAGDRTLLSQVSARVFHGVNVQPDQRWFLRIVRGFEPLVEGAVRNFFQRMPLNSM